MRVFKLLGCAAALALALAPGARADEWNKETILTFSGPVELPGITLPAGTYHFKLADPDSTRRVVRVLDKDQQHQLAMFLTIPNDRMEPADKPLVMFRETQAGAPEAVKAWFYPGERTGYEFVYPRQQATKLAKANHESVLSVADESMKNSSDQTPQAVASASVNRIDENGQIADNQRLASDRPEVAKGAASDRPVATSGSDRATPAGTSGSVAQAPARRQAQANTADNNTPDRSNTRANRRAARLPQTASPLELVQLLSALSLAAGFGVRRFRSR